VEFLVDKVALGQVFFQLLRFSPASIIPPLLHSHLSPPHEVCDSPDQAAHYHTSVLRYELHDPSLGWKGENKYTSTEQAVGSEFDATVLIGGVEEQAATRG
jgi:hypothetical protein